MPLASHHPACRPHQVDPSDPQPAVTCRPHGSPCWHPTDPKWPLGPHAPRGPRPHMWPHGPHAPHGAHAGIWPSDLALPAAHGVLTVLLSPPCRRENWRAVKRWPSHRHVAIWPSPPNPASYLPSMRLGLTLPRGTLSQPAICPACAPGSLIAGQPRGAHLLHHVRRDARTLHRRCSRRQTGVSSVTASGQRPRAHAAAAATAGAAAARFPVDASSPSCQSTLNLLQHHAPSIQRPWIRGRALV
jgi:hypothetical protein